MQVYFALSQFERRQPYQHLEPGLQRDLKAFFGDYVGAQAAVRELLFRIAGGYRPGLPVRRRARSRLAGRSPAASNSTILSFNPRSSWPGPAYSTASGGASVSQVLFPLGGVARTTISGARRVPGSGLVLRSAPVH